MMCLQVQREAVVGQTGVDCASFGGVEHRLELFPGATCHTSIEHDGEGKMRAAPMDLCQKQAHLPRIDINELRLLRDSSIVLS